jgi:hypothetical protein
MKSQTQEIPDPIMKSSLFGLWCLLLLSCAPRVKQVSSARRPVPRGTGAAGPGRVSNQETDRDDDRAEAEDEFPRDSVEFYLLRRTGGVALSADNLLRAKRHKDMMPAYSLASRRFVAPRAKGATVDAVLGT